MVTLEPFAFAKNSLSEDKESPCVLKCSQLHELPEALSKEFLLKFLPVISCKQFIISVVELIMLSWQQILLYNFHNTGATWFFYHIFKLKVHILHGLENISTFNIWKFVTCGCDVIFSETSLIFRNF